jgi:hypothetical protein
VLARAPVQSRAGAVFVARTYQNTARQSHPPISEQQLDLIIRYSGALLFELCTIHGLKASSV